MNILDFQKRKESGSKLTMITCYDYCFASILNESQVDCLLVGDSAGMVMHGSSNSLNVTVEMLALHVSAVVKGAPRKFVVGDLPFCSYRKGLIAAMEAAESLMRAGAQALKLEGASGNLEIVRHMVDSGIPVMGHLGLTPQSIHVLGGFKAQGHLPAVAEKLKKDALALEAAGCFALVLECVPSDLAKAVTESLQIPTIGIGAGPHTSGQVLVLQDMLGMTQSFKPKFLKTFLNGTDLVREAVNAYDSEVKKTVYPDVKEHCY